MSTCNLDHSGNDVLKKLLSQKDFLPDSLYEAIQLFLVDKVDQTVLNELFHLLKKYDLVSKDEQQKRNEEIARLII